VNQGAGLDRKPSDSEATSEMGRSGNVPVSSAKEQSSKTETSPEHAPRRGVALNSFWNLAGQTSPLLIAAFAIPVLIRQLGVDRFGVLTLAWILVGYLGLLDLGIGRAITKLLAEKMALGDSGAASSLIGTAIFSMMLLGVLLGGVLCALAPWLAHSALKVPAPLQSETMRSLYLMAIAIPFVTLANGFRGMLEAQQSFGVINVLRVGLGAVTYLGPLAVVPFSRNLVPVVATLVGARLISCGLHFWLCKRLIPAFSLDVDWNHKSLRELLSFGGWISVSNIISPIMVYLDRFLIGSLISMAAVAYYTTPFELVTKLWVIPTSLVSVLFPAFSETLAVGNNDRASLLYEGGVSSILAMLFPLTLVVVLFAPEALHLWLGTEFARRSGPVLQILAIGVFINSLANVPYALLQASGRPDLTAKLHLIELPCYAGLLYWTIRFHGIEGAAAAWAFRLFGETVILFFLVSLIVKRPLPRRLTISIAAGTAALLLASITTGFVLKLLFMVGFAGIFALLTWYWTFSELERLRFRSWLQRSPVAIGNLLT
jgi:O-antigen/teichoic acid export membrane protein